MNVFRLQIRTMLTIMLITYCTACSNDDSPQQEDNTTIEEYYSLLYGAWYREVNDELSKTFMSYKFSSNKSVVRYTKSASRTKSTMNGSTTYSEWSVDNEYSTNGLWYLEQNGNLIYLKIQWNGNNFYSGHLITYLDDGLLNFSDGFNSDLNKGDKSPNF